jgi:UDP-glucuronate 4-epimerase
MRTLLTGAAGFIGSHLGKRLLEAGDELVIVDNFNPYYDPALKRARIRAFFGRATVPVYEMNIADLDALQKVFQQHHFDRVIHLAAQAGVRYSLENPFSYESSNVLGTLNLLELVKRQEIPHFIFASSSSVYGGNTKIPFSEDDRTDQPLSLYAATKKSCEVMARSYHELYHFSVLGFRYFTVYGPWGRPDMALFQFTKNILAGEPVNVHNFGNMKRDFTFIDDAVEATLRLCSRQASGQKAGFDIMNVASGNPVELNRFLNILEKELGIPALRQEIAMQAGEVPMTFADLTKLKRMTNGWVPGTMIEEGVKRFVAWYKEYYDKTALSV